MTDANFTLLMGWATEHWWLAFWLVLWAMCFAYGLMAFAGKLVNRVFRMCMVLLRGWPPAHVDADGDWRPAPKESA